MGERISDFDTAGRIASGLLPLRVLGIGVLMHRGFSHSGYSGYSGYSCIRSFAAVQVSMLLDATSYHAFDSDVLTVAEPSVWSAVQVSHLDNPFEYALALSPATSAGPSRVYLG